MSVRVAPSSNRHPIAERALEPQSPLEPAETSQPSAAATRRKNKRRDKSKTTVKPPLDELPGPLLEKIAAYLAAPDRKRSSVTQAKQMIAFAGLSNRIAAEPEIQSLRIAAIASHIRAKPAAEVAASAVTTANAFHRLQTGTTEPEHYARFGALFAKADSLPYARHHAYIAITKRLRVLVNGDPTAMFHELSGRISALPATEAAAHAIALIDQLPLIENVQRGETLFQILDTFAVAKGDQLPNEKRKSISSSMCRSLLEHAMQALETFTVSDRRRLFAHCVREVLHLETTDQASLSQCISTVFRRQWCFGDIRESDTADHRYMSAKLLIEKLVPKLPVSEQARMLGTIISQTHLIRQADCGEIMLGALSFINTFETRAKRETFTAIAVRIKLLDPEHAADLFKQLLRVAACDPQIAPRRGLLETLTLQIHQHSRDVQPLLIAAFFHPSFRAYGLDHRQEALTYLSRALPNVCSEARSETIEKITLALIENPDHSRSADIVSALLNATKGSMPEGAPTRIRALLALVLRVPENRRRGVASSYLLHLLPASREEACSIADPTIQLLTVIPPPAIVRHLNLMSRFLNFGGRAVSTETWSKVWNHVLDTDLETAARNIIAMQTAACNIGLTSRLEIFSTGLRAIADRPPVGRDRLLRQFEPIIANLAEGEFHSSIRTLADAHKLTAQDQKQKYLERLKTHAEKCNRERRPAYLRALDQASTLLI